MNFLINGLITLALRHRYIVVALTLSLIGAGIIAFQQLAIEAYPDFTDPIVRVLTLMPGKGAEEVERTVTIPLEKELNGLPRQTKLRSVSIFGLSAVLVTFESGTPTHFARQQVLERIGQAELPEDAEPLLDPDATSSVGEIYRYTVESDYYDKMSLKAIQDWVLEKKFREIPGVVSVAGFGGPTKNYQVNIDAGRLKAYNLSINQVFEAVSRSNGSAGGNYIENNGQAYVVRGLGLIQDIDELAKVVVSSTVDGIPIRIKDLATINTGPGIRLGQVGKNNDDDVIEGIVLMRRYENPARVIEKVYDRLPEIQSNLPLGVKLVPLYDRMDLMRHTMDTIGHNVAAGIVLVVAILLMFMFEVKSALIAALVIPLSLMISFILLNLCHIPANLLSLGAVDFGIIIDGTVVMVENIHRRLAHEGRSLSPKGRIELVLHAAKEVGSPIVFATFIILVAFLPIFAFDGVAGKLFHPLAFTMNFALLGALLVSITIIPVIMAFLMTGKPIVERISPLVRLTNNLYRPLLIRAIRTPWPLLCITLLSLVTSVLLFLNVGSEFLPKLDEGNIWLRVTVLPTSVSLEKSVAIARNIRQHIMRYPEVKNVVSQIGAPDDGTDPNNPSNIEVMIDLYPATSWRKQWQGNKEAIVNAMDQDLNNIPGIVTTFSQYIQDGVDEAISGAKAELAVKLYGPDLHVLERLGDKLTALITNVPGMVDVASDKLLGQPQYRIQINRTQADRYGINVSDINQLVEIAIGGKVATEILEGERRFNVLVRLQKPFRANIEALDNLLITTPAGQTIPLSEVATIETATGATSIMRSENSRLVTIKANVRGRDLGSAVRDAQEVVHKNVVIPEGYRLVWGGQFENQQRANARMQVILPVTLIAIFAILYVMFRRVQDCLLAMIPIPLAAIGGIAALYQTHTYFSVSAGVGFIAAAGVSVLNGVIILSYIKELRRRHFSRLKAAIQGARTKLQPVLMAGSVAILGLVPAAVSTGIGSQSQKPFAIVIIGGLLVSTILSLFLIPVLYTLVSGRKGDKVHAVEHLSVVATVSEV